MLCWMIMIFLQTVKLAGHALKTGVWGLGPKGFIASFSGVQLWMRYYRVPRITVCAARIGCA